MAVTWLYICNYAYSLRYVFSCEESGGSTRRMMGACISKQPIVLLVPQNIYANYHFTCNLLWRVYERYRTGLMSMIFKTGSCQAIQIHTPTV